MTVKKEYRCNLCRDLIRPSDLAKKSGFGVYFDSSGGLALKDAWQAENHICSQCAGYIAKQIGVELQAKSAQTSEKEA